MITNYFKSSSGHTFFFADSVLESIESAYEAVTLCEPNPAVFRAVPLAGPWDHCKIIGHRSRSAILNDLSMSSDRDELEQLHGELVALQACYTGIGRSIPQVAA